MVTFVALVTILGGSESVDLQCDFMSFPVYVKDDVSGTMCTATGIAFKHANDTVTSVDGKSTPLPDIKTVKFYSPITVDYFPRGLEKVFPNLEAILILGSPLKSIEQSDLKPFGSKLKKLVIKQSEIEKLDSNLFEHNPELRWIEFNENKIKSVGKDLLKSLTLVRVDFYDNICINKGEKKKDQVQALITELEEKCQVEGEKVEEKSIVNEISDYFKTFVERITANDVEPAKSKLEVEESTTTVYQEIKETIKAIEESLSFPIATIDTLEESTVDPDAVAPLVILEVNESSRLVVKNIWEIISLACVIQAVTFFFSLS